MHGATTTRKGRCIDDSQEKRRSVPFSLGTNKMGAGGRQRGTLPREQRRQREKDNKEKEKEREREREGRNVVG